MKSNQSLCYNIHFSMHCVIAANGHILHCMQSSERSSVKATRPLLHTLTHANTHTHTHTHTHAHIDPQSQANVSTFTNTKMLKLKATFIHQQ